MNQQLPVSGEESQESSAQQLKIASVQGKAYATAFLAMKKEAYDFGEPQEIDDYKIGYVVEEAEGLWVWQGDELVWQDPPAESVHIEIMVADARSGRFLPYQKVQIAVSDQQDNQLFASDLPFLWHPWFYHYGSNLKFPEDGAYKMTVNVQPEPFIRHDMKNGNRFQRPVKAHFGNVRIKASQKHPLS